MQESVPAVGQEAPDFALPGMLHQNGVPYAF